MSDHNAGVLLNSRRFVAAVAGAFVARYYDAQLKRGRGQENVRLLCSSYAFGRPVCTSKANAWETECAQRQR